MELHLQRMQFKMFALLVLPTTKFDRVIIFFENQLKQQQNLLLFLFIIPKNLAAPGEGGGREEVFLSMKYLEAKESCNRECS